MDRKARNALNDEESYQKEVAKHFTFTLMSDTPS